ncbi:MAG: prephenate dehydrogenase [Flavobacteriaceae bacterium]|jgi:prephenate dehydrogenase
MKLAVVGVGLIGGSWAKALREHALVTEVLGVDRSEQHLEQAIKLGIIDRAVDYNQLAQADLVFVSIPVDQLVLELPKILDAVGPTTLVMDAGSTKLAICASVAEHPKRAHFLAAHPIAGTEFSGPNAAIADLYKGKLAIVCEIEKTAIDLQERAMNAFSALGMRVRYMGAKEHDVHVAYVSHLSHISAFMLGKTVMGKEKDDRTIFDLAGSGFASTVRLAKSSPQMWAPIFVQNKEPLLETLEAFIEHLIAFKDLIKNEDTQGLTEEMKRINSIEKILNPLPLKP